MFSRADILLGFVVPWLACAAMLAAAWQPWRRGAKSPRDGRWAGGIAIAAGYTIAYGRLVGELRLPATSPDNWIVHLAGVGALVGVAFCLLPVPKWARVSAGLVLAAVLCFVLLKPLVDPATVAKGAAAAWVAGGAVAITLWWLCMNQVALAGPRMLAPAVAMLAAAGAAAVLGEGGLAQRGGFTMGAAAAVLGASLAVAAFTPRFSLAGGGTLVAALIIPGTLFYAWFYIYPDIGPRMMTAIALVFAAPALAAVVFLPGVRNRSPWTRGIVAVLAVLLGVAAAVALVATDHAPQAAPADY